MKKCPKCNFIIIENDEPLTVLKMLRTRKRSQDDKKFPILVADFYCNNCKTSIHAKWPDLDRDINVLKCEKCENPLTASVFLGLMKGFTLESYCFSCYSKLNSGEFADFQK